MSSQWKRTSNKTSKNTVRTNTFNTKTGRTQTYSNRGKAVTRSVTYKPDGKVVTKMYTKSGGMTSIEQRTHNPKKRPKKSKQQYNSNKVPKEVGYFVFFLIVVGCAAFFLYKNFIEFF